MSGGTGSTTNKQAEVPREVDHANSNLDMLEKSISELETRLSGILKTQQPEEKAKKDEVDAQRVPLADNIRSIARRILTQSGRIANMISELEL